VHHSGHLNLTQDKNGLTILNAEDFYAALVLASKRYFDTVKTDPVLQKAFAERANQTGILVIR